MVFWSRSEGKRLLRSFLCLSFCAVLSAPALSQAVYGNIFGTITNQSGAAVAGVRVTVASVQKATTFQTTTQGVFNLPEGIQRSNIALASKALH